MNQGQAKIGIALIGTSSMAHRHARAFLKIDEAKLLGVFGSDFERACNFAETHGIRSYKTLEELLSDPEVSIVDIVTLHNQHADFGIQVARAKKHVIVEKPIDISVAKAKKLVQECKQNGVYLSTISQHRFNEAEQKLKKIIESGALGQVFLASTRLIASRDQDYYDASGGWRGKKELAGGGVFINQAIHNIDILVYLLGEAACVQADTEIFSHDIEVEDTGVAIVRFKNNVLATIYTTTSAFATLPNILEVHGTRGSATISGSTLALFGVSSSRIDRLKNKILNKLRSRLPYIFDFKKKLKFGSHEQNLAQIIKAIKNDQLPPVAFEEGLKSLEIVEAILKSSDEKAAVILRPAAKKNFLGKDYFKRYLKEAQERKTRKFC